MRISIGWPSEFQVNTIKQKKNEACGLGKYKMTYYHLAYIFIGTAMGAIALGAIGAWKLPKEKAKRWVQIFHTLSFSAGLYSIYLLSVFTREQGASYSLALFISFMIPPLSFFALAYVQYLKNKEDVANLQAVVQRAVVTFLVMIVYLFVAIIFWAIA